jgi:hypothetical protein
LHSANAGFCCGADGCGWQIGEGFERGKNIAALRGMVVGCTREVPLAATVLTDRSIDRSIDHSITRSLDHSITRSLDHSITRSIKSIKSID